MMAAINSAASFTKTHRRRVFASIIVLFTTTTLIAILLYNSNASTQWRPLAVRGGVFGDNVDFSWNPQHRQLIRRRTTRDQARTSIVPPCPSHRLLLFVCERYAATASINTVESVADFMLHLVAAKQIADHANRTLIIDNSRCQSASASLSPSGGTISPCCHITPALTMPTTANCNLSDITTINDSARTIAVDNPAQQCSGEQDQWPRASIAAASSVLHSMINLSFVPPLIFNDSILDCDDGCGIHCIFNGFDGVIVPSSSDVGNILHRIRIHHLSLRLCKLAVIAKSVDGETIRNRMERCGVNVHRIAEQSTDSLHLLLILISIADARRLVVSYRSSAGRFVALVRHAHSMSTDTIDDELWYLMCRPSISRNELPYHHRPHLTRIRQLSMTLPSPRHRRVPLFIIVGCNGCGQERVRQFLQSSHLVSYDGPLSAKMSEMFRIAKDISSFLTAKREFLQSLEVSDDVSPPRLIDYRANEDETVAMSMLHSDVSSVVRIIGDAALNIDVRVIVCIRSPIDALLDFVRTTIPPAKDTKRLIMADDPLFIFHARTITEQLSALQGDLMTMPAEMFAVFDYEKLWSSNISDMCRLAQFINHHVNVNDVFNAMMKYRRSLDSILFPSVFKEFDRYQQNLIGGIFASVSSMEMYHLRYQEDVPTLKYDHIVRSNMTRHYPIGSRVKLRADVISYILRTQFPHRQSCRHHPLLIFNGQSRWNVREMDVFAQINEILRTMTLAMATKRTFVLPPMDDSILAVIHPISSCTIDDAELTVDQLNRTDSEADALNHDIRVVTMSADFYDFDLIRHVNSRSCTYSDNDCEAVGVDDAIALAIDFLLIRYKASIPNTIEPVCGLIVERASNITAIEYANIANLQQSMTRCSKIRIISNSADSSMPTAKNSNIVMMNLIKELIDNSNRMNVTTSIVMTRSISESIIDRMSASLCDLLLISRSSLLMSTTATDLEIIARLLSLIESPETTQYDLFNEPTIIGLQRINDKLSIEWRKNRPIDRFLFNGDIPSSSSSLFPSRNPIVYSRTLVRKNIYSRSLRFVFVAGTEGTGHHFIGNVFASMQKLNEAGALDHLQMRSNDALSDLIWSYLTPISTEAFIRDRTQLLQRLKIFTENNQMESETPPLYILNVVSTGSSGMMSYPNKDVLIKNIEHPLLVPLTMLFEAARCDLRIIVVSRDPIASLYSTILRHHAEETVGATQSFYFQSRVLHDNRYDLMNDVNAIDNAFVFPIDLPTLSKNATHYAAGLSSHLIIPYATIHQALIRQTLSYPVKTTEYAFAGLSSEEIEVAGDFDGSVADIIGSWRDEVTYDIGRHHLRMCRPIETIAPALVSSNHSVVPVIGMSNGGGTLLRWMIEQSTGRKTAAADWNDITLPYPQGQSVITPNSYDYIMEMIKNRRLTLIDYRYHHSTNEVRKSNSLYQLPLSLPSRRIYLLRDPLSVALTTSMDAIGELEHLQAAKLSNLFTPRLVPWIYNANRELERIINQTFEETADVFNDFVSTHNIIQLLRDQKERTVDDESSPLVILFDELVEHPNETIRRIVSYLNYDIDESALTCLLKSLDRVSHPVSLVTQPMTLQKTTLDNHHIMDAEYTVTDWMSLSTSYEQTAVMPHPFKWTNVITQSIHIAFTDTITAALQAIYLLTNGGSGWNYRDVLESIKEVEAQRKARSSPPSSSPQLAQLSARLDLPHKPNVHHQYSRKHARNPQHRPQPHQPPSSV